jgi:hypothetical protein
MTPAKALYDVLTQQSDAIGHDNRLPGTGFEFEGADGGLTILDGAYDLTAATKTLMTDTEQNLRAALVQCLERIHDFVSLTEAEMKAAVDDAASNAEWSMYDEYKWREMAYPKKT